MDSDKTITKTYVALQRAIKNWGKLLIAAGGTLKPDKCFFHLMDFPWSRRCGWQYIEHHKDETASMILPLPDGSTAPIQHQAVDDAQKPLGSLHALL
jgi:hypothetical protein